MVSFIRESPNGSLHFAFPVSLAPIASFIAGGFAPSPKQPPLWGLREGRPHLEHLGGIAPGTPKKGTGRFLVIENGFGGGESVDPPLYKTAEETPFR